MGHRVVGCVPLRAESRRRVHPLVDDVDTRDSGIIDCQVVVGYAAAVGVYKEVAVAQTVGGSPHAVDHVGSVLLREIFAQECGIGIAQKLH